MPRHYKKKYTRKSHRPGYVACGRMVASDAQKALAMAKYLKGIVNVEFKHLDNAQTNLTMPATVGTIVQLTNVVLGDTSITRDGSNIKIVSIYLEYDITQHVTATATACRVMFVHDRQTNQAIFTTADLLHDVTAIDVINSPRNLDNTSRFQVLYDKKHYLSDTNNLITSGKFHKKVQFKLRYDANAGTIADLTQSSLALVVFSNEATNAPTFHGFIRLRYVDN